MTSVDSPLRLNMLCVRTKITTLYCGSCSFSEPGPMGPAEKGGWGGELVFLGGKGGVTLAEMTHKLSTAAAGQPSALNYDPRPASGGLGRGGAEPSQVRRLPRFVTRTYA